MSSNERILLGILLAHPVRFRFLNRVFDFTTEFILNGLSAQGFVFHTTDNSEGDGSFIFPWTLLSLDDGSRQMAHDALDAPDPEARSDEFDAALLEAERALL
ncbi:hypothetical protein ACJU26_04810 [Acidithiobacillus sp. M4-SHS-6]|uniref:hypothetical protein n=1 Tax=Acidithiobacillus sp. M4-SHS-6 TaxID=3383024 RepID=UPI0039BE6641